jgi:hypothetical protein
MCTSIDQVGEERACGCVCHPGHRGVLRPWLVGSRILNFDDNNNWVSILEEVLILHPDFFALWSDQTQVRKGQ